MESRETILIVGAGFGQLPAIQQAKQMGLNVICTDRNKEAIGSKIADYFYTVDIIDKEKTLEVAQKHMIKGIMTMQSDLPVPTIGYINDVMNLNGVSYEVANRCSNKIETREKLKSEKCSQPDYRIISSVSQAIKACEEIGYPCILKAPDSSGSRGVTKVENKDEIKSAFQEALKYTRQDKLLVEEFIEGLEFGAQTFSVGGTCEIVLLHSDILSPKPYMIPIGHSFPFLEIEESYQKKAISDIKKAINILGITNGPANIDLIWDKNEEKVKIIEVGARIGATCLPELVFYHTGINWIEQTILNSLNKETNLIKKRNQAVTAVIYSANKDGILKDYQFPLELVSKNLLEYEITAKKGEKVNRLRKGTDRIGKVIFKGISIEESKNKCLEFINNTKIEID